MANKLRRPFINGRKEDKPSSDTVQIWPFVPMSVRRAAEEVAGRNLAAGEGPRTANAVFRDWLESVIVIREAASPADIRRAVASIRGITPKTRARRVASKRAHRLPSAA